MSVVLERRCKAEDPRSGTPRKNARLMDNITKKNWRTGDRDVARKRPFVGHIIYCHLDRRTYCLLVGFTLRIAEDLRML